MAGVFADFYQMLPGVVIQVVLLQGQRIQTDDGVHGRADFMTHVSQERGFRLACFLRGLQGFGEDLALGHGVAHFRVHVGDADDDEMIVVLHAGGLHADVDGSAAGELAVGHDEGVFQAEGLHQRFAGHGLAEGFPVLGKDVCAHFRDRVAEEMETAAYLRQRVSVLIPAVLDELLGVGVDIIHVGVVPGQGLGDMGVHEAGGNGFFVGLLIHGVLMLDANQIRDILTHAKDAELTGGVRVFQLCGLELTGIAGGIRNILEENIGRRERKSDFVILDKMPGGFRIENLGIGEADDPFGRALVGIIGKGLVAGQIDAGFCVLGEGHAGHVVQKRKDGVIQRSCLFGFPQFPGVFLLFIHGDKGMEHGGGQHIGDGIQGKIGEPQLAGQEDHHDQTEEGKDQITLVLFRTLRLTEHGRKSVARDQGQQRDLETEQYISKGKGRINGLGVHREEQGHKNVDNGKNGDHHGKNVTGNDQKAAKGSFFLEVCDGIAGPVQHTCAHGQIIGGGVGKEQRRQFEILENAPENIRDIIGQHREQEAPVHFPGRFFGDKLPVEEDIPVHDEQDQDCKNTYG